MTRPVDEQGIGVCLRDDAELCPECSLFFITKDGLCDDCWAFVNGPLGVGA